MTQSWSHCPGSDQLVPPWPRYPPRDSPGQSCVLICGHPSASTDFPHAAATSQAIFVSSRYRPGQSADIDLVPGRGACGLARHLPPPAAVAWRSWHPRLTGFPTSSAIERCRRKCSVPSPHEEVQALFVEAQVLFPPCSVLLRFTSPLDSVNVNTLPKATTALILLPFLFFSTCTHHSRPGPHIVPHAAFEL